MNILKTYIIKESNNNQISATGIILTILLIIKADFFGLALHNSCSPSANGFGISSSY